MIYLRANEGTVKTNKCEVAELLAHYLIIQLHSILEEIVSSNMTEKFMMVISVKVIRETFQTNPDAEFEFRKLSHDELIFTLEPLKNVYTPV